MSDSNIHAKLQPNPSNPHLLSANLETKNVNTVQDILETIKKHCIQVQSFPELKKFCTQFQAEYSLINEALSLFLRQLIQALSYMFLNSTNSKFRGSGTLLMENVKPFEEKILKDPQVFQESCRIFYNMQNLTEISLEQANTFCPKEKKQRDPVKKNTQKLLRSKIKKSKSKPSAKNPLKSKKKTILEQKKILLRLLPYSTETHQIMMKLENFPRLELKVSSNNFVKNISEYLTKKWFSTFPRNYQIHYYPDEAKWLKNINIQKNNSEKLSSLSENYMINDIYSAYNCPENKVIYIFYELKELECDLNPKKEILIMKKTSTLSTNPNSSKENSEENYLFAQNLLKNMDLLKNHNEIIPEKVMESMNLRDLSCTNYLNINEFSNKEGKNSHFFASRLGKAPENTTFSLHDLKKSINFTNFSGSLNNFKWENSEPCSKNISSQREINNKSKGLEPQNRKDVKHLNKIKDLVDLVGKKYENMKKN